MRRIGFGALLLAGLALGAAQVDHGLIAQGVRGTGTDVPELIYYCPMVQDNYTAAAPGKCPKCGMDLKPARLKEGFTCTTHDAIIQEKGGACPIDKRELVSVAVSVYWNCANAPDEKLMTPGKCPDGTARTRRLEKQPHADHNPRHGGVLFMADTGWHHVEGTYPSAGLFRVFFYDELTRPMSVKGFSARATVVDAKGTSIETVTLKPGRVSNTMEASVKKASLPFSVQLRVRFKPDDRERPFDFPPFTALTKEPAAPAAVTTKATPAQPAPAPKPAVVEPPPPALAAVEQNPTQPQAPGTGGSLELMPSQVRQPLALPGTSKELITMLTTYSDEVKSLVDQGLLTQLWQPALNTKDVALGLDDHSNELPDDRRSKALIAVRRIVTSAWEIDAFADLGDKQKVLAAHNTFAAGVADLKAAYAR